MITRDKAISTLYELINAEIISENLEQDLEDIVRCISAEDKETGLGIDLWGAEEDDWVDLYTAKVNPYESSAPYNTDELKKEYDEWVEHCQKVYDKYKIRGDD